MKDINSQIIESNFDIQKVFFRALKYWYLFPIFFLLSLTLSVYNFKTTEPEWKIGCQLLISNDNSKAASIGKSAESSGALPSIFLGGDQSNIENQLIILKSYSQIEKTIKQLDFQVSYYRIGHFQTIDIYKANPFRVVMDTANIDLFNSMFEIEFVSKDEFVLRNNDRNEFEEKHSFFEKIENEYFTFSIVPNEKVIKNTSYVGNKFGFVINDMYSLVRWYSGSVEMVPINKSSIFEVSIIENNTQKGIDFLNVLANNSVNYTLDKKNLIAINTINFIEKQLVGVSDSLSASEKVLEDFRSRNEMMDISKQGQMIIEQSQELENQRAEVAVKLDYYNYLINYIENNLNVQDIMVPSSMGVQDPMLTALIGELTTINAEKSSMQFNSSTSNPNITRLDKRIQTVKTSIVENTRSIIATTNLIINDLDKRIMSLSGQIRRLPKTEQMLLGIERKFQMSNEMHTFLLTKRSEAQLAKAANMPDNEIVERARVLGQVKPDMKRVLFVLVFFGMVIPSFIIFFLVYYNSKIQDKDDIEVLTQVPIIGQVPLNKKADDARFISYEPRSSLAEAYRGVRTSLSYYLSDSPNRTFLVTSVIPGEGKSFSSTNIATTHALMGKKTILLGFDLRKPGIGRFYHLNDKDYGIANYYIGDSKTNLNVVKTDIENLDVLFAGETPPNPAELIGSDKTAALFAKLKSEYDVIVIDTPPIGVVADAYLLSEYSDVNIIVVRHDYTPKSILKQFLNDDKFNKLKHCAIVINGMPLSAKGYSAMYGYGKDYYTAG